MPIMYGAMNFPVRPVLSELESAGRFGFDYLELTMDPPEAHYSAIRQQQDTLMKALEERDLKLVCHLPSFVSTADLTESIREASLKEVLASLEVAADFTPMKAVLHPSYHMGLSVFVRDRAHTYALKSLEAIVEKAESLGITLCLENMFPRSNSLAEPEHFSEIFERFPSLKMTLDIGHAHIGSKGPRKALAFIDSFQDRIGHIHASDNFGKEDNHLPIGAGIIEYEKIVKGLQRIGYDETITLEIFSRDRDYLKISKEKLAAMIDAV
jgi:sugar phosphate isomerase/epimerase